MTIIARRGDVVCSDLLTLSSYASMRGELAEKPLHRFILNGEVAYLATSGILPSPSEVQEYQALAAELITGDVSTGKCTNTLDVRSKPQKLDASVVVYTQSQTYEILQHKDKAYGINMALGRDELHMLLPDNAVKVAAINLGLTPEEVVRYASHYSTICSTGLDDEVTTHLLNWELPNE